MSSGHRPEVAENHTSHFFRPKDLFYLLQLDLCIPPAHAGMVARFSSLDDPGGHPAGKALHDVRAHAG